MHVCPSSARPDRGKNPGFRDYEKKLPITPDTQFQIASNTKLFTAVATGMLVEEKKLAWDTPVRRFVPSVKFYNEDLDNSVTIRDMLSHRTGISRHDLIWYKSDFSRQELFDRLRCEEAQGVGPAGSIISDVRDMSRWLITLLNTALETRGYGELLNPVYGMGRWFASYRGHYLAFHGGDLPGLHSQVSCMPYDSIGVVVLIIGDHAAPPYNVISYNIYERLLGMNLTPWSERRLKDRLEAKAAGTEGRKKAGAERVSGAPPSHPIADYVGQYEPPAYGIITITKPGSSLAFQLHHISLPLSHFHYDRFDTPDDEEDGLFSVNF